MKVPGVVWSALLVALPLLAVWLGDSFPGAVWVAPVAGLLLIVVKVIEVIRSEVTERPDTLEVMMADREPAPEPGKTERILWG
jgi:hypothetical protein